MFKDETEKKTVYPEQVGYYAIIPNIHFIVSDKCSIRVKEFMFD